MQIRSAQVTDLGRIDHLYNQGLKIALQGEGATHPVRLWQMLTRTLSAMLPLAIASEMLYVLEQDDKVMGFIQGEILTAGNSRVRRGEEAVRVVNLSLDPELSGAAGGGLIDHLCNAALGRGVSRIYVRIPEGHAAAESFRAHLFVPYARDRVFYRPDLDGLVSGDGPAGLRPVRKKDLLGLFTLYLACTPKAVSQVEAPDFTQWRLVYENEWLGRFARRPARGHVIDQGEITGWLGVEPGAPGRPHTISLMAREDGAAGGTVVSQLLGWAVGRLNSHPGPIWSNVRNYDTATTRVLQDAGFEALAGQELLVRDLRARALAPARKRKKEEKAFVPTWG
jgi:hypothetical protein